MNFLSKLSRTICFVALGLIISNKTFAEISFSGYQEFFAGSADQSKMLGLDTSDQTDQSKSGFDNGTYTRIIASATTTLDSGIEVTGVYTLAKDNDASGASEAAARVDVKKNILKYFKKAKLFELYGSSESGWVTMLHPHQQFDNIGTVGKEVVGTDIIKLLNKNFKEVEEGEVGELYAKTPYNFSHYWNNTSKTKKAFFNDYVTVGDLAKRNKDGFIELVDRKKNMIISGGENIYPSEVENIIGSNILIKDLAIIGYPDKKWGEIVCCFAILKEGAKLTEKELILWTKKKLASYKCPKKVFFIDDKDMPRNTTGKILHKHLREKIKFLIKEEDSGKRFK